VNEERRTREDWERRKSEKETERAKKRGGGKVKR